MDYDEHRRQLGLDKAPLVVVELQNGVVTIGAAHMGAAGNVTITPARPGRLPAKQAKARDYVSLATAMAWLARKAPGCEVEVHLENEDMLKELAPADDRVIVRNGGQMRMIDWSTTHTIPLCELYGGDVEIYDCWLKIKEAEAAQAIVRYCNPAIVA